MSSLLKPSTRSLSTFRPRSLFPSVTLSFLPHTLSLSLPLFLSWPSSLRCTHTHTFIALFLCYLPHTPRNTNTCMCAHTANFPLLIFSPALLAETRNYTSVNLHFSNSIVSLNPKLAKESAPIQQSGSLSRFTVDPFTP